MFNLQSTVISHQPVWSGLLCVVSHRGGEAPERKVVWLNQLMCLCVRLYSGKKNRKEFGVLIGINGKMNTKDRRLLTSSEEKKQSYEKSE